MTRAVRGIFLIFLLTTEAAAGPKCGEGGRCSVPGGYYLAEAPAGWDGVSSLPLVVYFHGWNASPEGTFKNRSMVNPVLARGALFVAPYARTGYWRQIGAGRAEAGRDEAAFVRAVMADIRMRWPIDTTRTLASGFSRGASMVWNVACFTGDLFTAYLPIAGGFWNSMPADCPTGPVSLRHIHGLSDTVVAFDAVGRYNSVSIIKGIDFLAELNGCAAEPTGAVSLRKYDCEIWPNCRSGREVQLCTHPGGHSIPGEWVAEGYDWMLRLTE